MDQSKNKGIREMINQLVINVNKPMNKLIDELWKDDQRINEAVSHQISESNNQQVSDSTNQ